MRNIDFIKQMSAKELARLLVYLDHEEDIDYDWNEEPYLWGLQDVYVTSDGERFYDDEDEAVRHEIFWLKQERE